jgi:cytochrome c-type biogenesis protein CcmH
MALQALSLALRSKPGLQKLGWLAATAAVGLSLAVGAGAFGGAGPRATLYQRTLEVAGEYRCPVCQGESAATSQAPEAAEIRALVAGWLKEGRTQAQIRSALVADYGTSILEKPPASGLGFLLWGLPLVVVALAGGGLSLALVRWRRPAQRQATEASEASPAAAGLGWRPHLAAWPAATAALRRLWGTRRYERAGFAAGVGLIALAGALWLVDQSSAPRPSTGAAVGGQGEGAATVAADLQAANFLAATQPVTALALYGEVLANEPGEPAALTGEAVIYAHALMARKALSLLAEVEKESPAYAPAHLDRALVLLDYAHKPREAVAELRWYLAHGPKGQGQAEAARALATATAEEAAG